LGYTTFEVLLPFNFAAFVLFRGRRYVSFGVSRWQSSESTWYNSGLLTSRADGNTRQRAKDVIQSAIFFSGDIWCLWNEEGMDEQHAHHG